MEIQKKKIALGSKVCSKLQVKKDGTTALAGYPWAKENLATLTPEK